MTRYTELILYKVYADFRVEASRGYLGVLWWVLEPLLYMIVFYIVFGVLLKRGGDGYVAFLLSGLVAWRWFDNTVRVGSNSLVANVGLIQQVYVPKIVFPTVTVVTNTTKFLVVLVILMLFLIMYDVTPKVTWLALPVLVVIQLIFILSVTWVVSAIVPFIPDLRVIIDSGLTLLFFMSGIFFEISSLPSAIEGYLRLNPIANLIDSYRQILVYGLWPDWNMLGMVTLVGLVLMVSGLRLHMYYDRHFAKIGLV